MPLLEIPRVATRWTPGDMEMSGGERDGRAGLGLEVSYTIRKGQVSMVFFGGWPYVWAQSIRIDE